METTLLNLPIEDIFDPLVFEHLDIRDLLNLLETNRRMEYSVKKYLQNVKEIDFSKRNSESISEKQFSILHENCRKLLKLNFNGCNWLTDCKFKPLLLNNIEHLEKLYLNNCVGISEEVLQLLPKCRSLIELKTRHVNLSREEYFYIYCSVYKNNKTLSCHNEYYKIIQDCADSCNTDVRLLISNLRKSGLVIDFQWCTESAEEDQ